MGRMAAGLMAFAAAGSSPGAAFALLHTAQAANETPATQVAISRFVETTFTDVSYSYLEVTQRQSEPPLGCMFIAMNAAVRSPATAS
jgi:hypothetical protein